MRLHTLLYLPALQGLWKIIKATGKRTRQAGPGRKFPCIARSSSADMPDWRERCASLMRQIGSGGILASLWELAETVRTGFEIEMPQINLKQETVEICEFYRLNPYLMTSAGSYLILTSQAESVIRALEEAGAPAVRLGEARDQNARVIRNGEEIRYLDRPAPDELERWRTEH